MLEVVQTGQDVLTMDLIYTLSQVYAVYIFDNM